MFPKCSGISGPLYFVCETITLHNRRERRSDHLVVGNTMYNLGCFTHCPINNRSTASSLFLLIS